MKVLLNSLQLLLVLCITVAEAQRRQPIVLEEVTIIDSWNNGPIRNGYIVIEGNTISYIGKQNEIIIPGNAQIINLKGKYVIPGLIDVESQFRTTEELVMMLAWGVTSANCSFESVEEGRELFRQTTSDTTKYPEIYITAPIFTAEQHSVKKNTGIDSTLSVFPTTPEEAREQVRKIHANKINRMKIIYDDKRWCRDPLSPFQKLDSSVVLAVLTEAKKLGISVAIQASSMNDVQLALDAGVSAIIHGVHDIRFGSSTVDQMVQRNTYYVSTLSLFEYLADAEGFFKNVFADSLFRKSLAQTVVAEFTSSEFAIKQREQFPNFTYVKEHLPIVYDNSETIVKNYVPVPMGTDLPHLPGISAHLELENMVKAGLTPLQAIVSATAISAEYLGVRKKVGFLFTNYQADILVLDKNPLEDIRNTRTISMIIKKGKIFYPKDLRDTAQE